ncbi:T-complex protein 11-like protein 1 [Hordeum vulgare]|nr:T-complex protein 11-like protein 1 [Hordeum vulgare]
MEIPAEEGAAARVPPRIRRRLLEGRASGGGGPASAEEIEAKLKEADHRRQQFYDWLSCKARKKPRSPSWSSQEEDYGQRLEARLQAAEQKRLSLLAKAQNRLAKLDELRQAAKNDVEMRFEKEKEELETRVESRVRQAEENRMRLLHADMQRRAALKERTERSLVQKATSESKYTERVRSAILEKRAAAEKKRLALLEAEKRKAHARLMHIQQAAMTVSSQREAERIKLKEHLESKLQRAKRKRAEYLKQRGSPCSSAHADYIKHADILSRKLARCWRSFVKSRKTTLGLAQAYDALGINEKSVKSMPFDELAMLMGSPTALEATKALLDRFERRLTLFQSASSSSSENIDHLLKRLVTPKRKVTPSRDGRTRVPAKRPARTTETSRLSRYSLRVVLCAYMILAHPSAVLSEDGEQEKLLMESAANFVREFELLVKTILEGPGKASRQPSLDGAESSSCQKSSDVAGQSKFKIQLVNFDKAWCTYLYRFVVWKVKDARSLEGDLVRAACKLELSMMQTCKLTAQGQSHNLTHDMKAIQKQVSDDQTLLREKVQHLSGDAGIERMETALSDARSKFFEAKENGSPLATPVANVSTPLSIDSSGKPPPSEVNTSSKTDAEGSRSVVRSLFGASGASSSTSPVNLPTENEQMVNEMLHEDGGAIAGNSNDGRTIEKDFQDKVRETMEKAFWDVVTDSMRGDKPDYSQLINLVKEVRDSLHDLAPKGWKEEIYENIDLEILSQVLESGSQDTQYLGQILQYSLDMVRKLSAAAKDDEMKASHDKLLSELAASSEVNDNGVSSFVIAVIKGLRFTLEEIKQLQVEVSKAYVQLMQPTIKGSAGVEYLQKAFGERYGPPANAAALPVTLQWISASKSIVDAEWSEHLGSLSILPAANHAQPLVTVLRAGHGAPTAAVASAGSSGLPECKGEKVDKLVRVGLLQLISGMEGLQLQSTPESFHLNFLRLRAVQGQFQVVIVMATSMLVLRQVLMSENSKITPLELETVISELFGALVKLLDSSPEAGTEEIVEAMMSASASAGSLSDARTQARRQIITRVLLKSLQADDVVFKKVSRAVHCAFRGVVLGGSGAKGQKLADAALRRVGAAKLAGRVVKAAEVLIRVATVSEKVHGPWYKALA